MRHVAWPLPECLSCDRPTRREVHDRNDGLCTECKTGIAETVRMLPVRLPPPPDDLTGYVERWKPPVPGQQAIDEDQS